MTVQVFKYGSPGRARTSDPMINSHLLYQLSYRGNEACMVLMHRRLVNCFSVTKWWIYGQLTG